jgi:5-keto 4-deoxyuronate isomerase
MDKDANRFWNNVPVYTYVRHMKLHWYITFIENARVIYTKKSEFVTNEHAVYISKVWEVNQM